MADATRMTPRLLTKALALCLLLTLACPAVAHAETGTERAGTYLMYLMPAFALGYSTAMGDYEGDLQMIESTGTTGLTTLLLKSTVHADRPAGAEGAEGESFPSGHTAIAFSSAAYLQMRYGYALGLPAYAAASFVGYSRIQGGEHHWVDVLAGAGLGIGFSYLFTEPYHTEDFDLSAYASPVEVGLVLTVRF